AMSDFHQEVASPSPRGRGLGEGGGRTERDSRILSRLPLLLVHFLELGVDDLVLRLAGGSTASRGRSAGALRLTRARPAARVLLRPVHRFADLHRGLAETVGCGFER